MTPDFDFLPYLFLLTALSVLVNLFLGIWFFRVLRRLSEQHGTSADEKTPGNMHSAMATRKSTHVSISGHLSPEKNFFNKTLENKRYVVLAERMDSAETVIRNLKAENESLKKIISESARADQLDSLKIRSDDSDIRVSALENELSDLTELLNSIRSRSEHIEESQLELFSKCQLLADDVSHLMDEEVSHDFYLQLANEISKFELNLSRMSPDTRGYKQLKRSLGRIKDSFMNAGYEFVDLMNKPYVDGMNLIANFDDDESLAPGTRIITGIQRPQVNYQGKLIQSAMVTVSQNLQFQEAEEEHEPDEENVTGEGRTEESAEIRESTVIPADERQNSGSVSEESAGTTLSQNTASFSNIPDSETESDSPANPSDENTSVPVESSYHQTYGTAAFSFSGISSENTYAGNEKTNAEKTENAEIIDIHSAGDGSEHTDEPDACSEEKTGSSAETEQKKPAGTDSAGFSSEYSDMHGSGADVSDEKTAHAAESESGSVQEFKELQTSENISAAEVEIHQDSSATEIVTADFFVSAGNQNADQQDAFHGCTSLKNEVSQQKPGVSDEDYENAEIAEAGGIDDDIELKPDGSGESSVSSVLHSVSAFTADSHTAEDNEDEEARNRQTGDCMVQGEPVSDLTSGSADEEPDNQTEASSEKFPEQTADDSSSCSSAVETDGNISDGDLNPEQNRTTLQEQDQSLSDAVTPELICEGEESTVSVGCENDIRHSETGSDFSVTVDDKKRDPDFSGLSAEEDDSLSDNASEFSENEKTFNDRDDELQQNYERDMYISLMNELMTNGVNLTEENADLHEESITTDDTLSYAPENEFSSVSESRRDISDIERNEISSSEKTDYDNDQSCGNTEVNTTAGVSSDGVSKMRDPAAVPAAETAQEYESSDVVTEATSESAEQCISEIEAESHTDAAAEQSAGNGGNDSTAGTEAGDGSESDIKIGDSLNYRFYDSESVSESLPENGSEMSVHGNDDLTADTLSVPEEKSDASVRDALTQNPVSSGNINATAEDSETETVTGSADSICTGSEGSVSDRSSESKSEDSGSHNKKDRQQDLERIRLAYFKKKGKKFRHRR